MIDGLMLGGLLSDCDHWTANWLLPAGLVLITMALLMGVLRRRRQMANRGTAREQVERLKQESGMRGDLETLMVEIEQLAKRLGAQLDAKTVQLEKLLREADARITELRRHQAGGAEPGPAGGVAGAAAGTAVSADLPAAPLAVAEPDPPSGDDALARRVDELDKKGLASVEIARQLNEHVGKVELILALRNA